MSRIVGVVLLVCAAVPGVAGCGPDIPAGKLACEDALQCPPGWYCIHGRCWEMQESALSGSETDGSVDAGEVADASAEAGGIDGGVDAGTPEGADGG